MPTLNIEMFDDEPKVGDKIKVTGVIQSISDDGKVEASYDEVSIVNEKESEDSEDDSEGEKEEADLSLDKALSKSFPNTQ